VTSSPAISAGVGLDLYIYSVTTLNKTTIEQGYKNIVRNVLIRKSKFVKWGKKIRNQKQKAFIKIFFRGTATV
jgi:hypothetical protein